MNPDLQNRVFEWVSTAANAVGEWTAREVPLFIQEYLTWKFWENVLGVGAFLVGFVIFLGIWLAIRFTAYKWADKGIKEGRDNDGELYALKWIPILVWTVICLLTFAAQFPYQNAVNIVKIKVAPKVYLLEEAAKFIKK